TTACQSDPAQLTVRVKDYSVDAGDDFEIPHGISTYLDGEASGGGDDLYYTWEPESLIRTGLHTLQPYTWNIYQDTTFYLIVTDNTMANCTKMDSVRITLNGAALSVNPSVDPPLVCPGGEAQLAANASGGSGNYTYTWSASVGLDPIPPTADSPYVHPLVPTTYTVIVSDSFNVVNGSVDIAIKDPPEIHTVIGGGPYCANGSGVTIGLDGSTFGDTYELWHNGVSVSPIINGNNDPITFGTYLDPGEYTAIATSISQPQCTSEMDSSATVSIILLPIPYPVTGGGSYSQGGNGLPIGLEDSQVDVDYELLHEGSPMSPPNIVTGTNEAISFGNQTEAGTYTVIASTQTTPVCTAMMLDSAVIIINPWPTVYTLLGGGEICADDSTGVPIWLEDSEGSITYRLFRNGTQFGDTLVGTNDSVVFDTINKAGTYWANGTNRLTGLMRYMDDTVTIIVLPLPLVYVMGSYGDNCPGTEIMLNGSQLGVNYELQLNQSPVDTMPGTGLPLNFGPVNDPGIYGIRAYDTLTGCDTLMNNPITINPAPEVFMIQPIGISCAGDTVWLSGSEIGIMYQLQRDGMYNIGAPREGTGDTLIFGPQFMPGDYTILAYDTVTNCNILMDSVAHLKPVPDPYTIIPSGDTCESVLISLSGSQLGVKYIVKRDTLWLDTVIGTGNLLPLGTYTIPGVYTVVGYDTTTYKFCSNQMLGSTIIHPNPIPYQIIPMGYACEGDSIGLVHSDTGVVYQLIRNGNQNMGDPVTGAGDTIWFGVQILPGTYTVIGRSQSTNCWGDMTGSTVLTPNPTLYTIIPEGDTCSGTPIGLNGSQIGVNYFLLLDGVPQDTLPGSGNILSFGPQWLGGTYVIKAINETPDSCDAIMTGSTIIHQLPIAYNVTPAGISCGGDTVGLSDSDTGVIYQLIRDDITLTGTSQPGTGFPLSFGPQIIPGVYKVIATTQEADCYTIMNDSATLIPIPTIFTIVPQGDTCANSIIELNGSQLGVTYRLFQDTIYLIDTQPGTGFRLSFGPLASSGFYQIFAFNSSDDSCSAWMEGSVTIHPNPEIFNVIPSGTVCPGDTIRLSYSHIGINYYLKKDNSIIDTLPGSNSMLNFGYWDFPGVYTVIAQNPSAPHCWSNMNLSLTIGPMPTIYTLIPNGDTCENVPINLNGSQKGVDYTLRENGWPVLTIPGTGDPLTFSYVTTPATYTVLAIDTTTGCQQLMNGSLVVHPRPFAYDIMPQGMNCEPTDITLTNTQAGVEYRLIRNGVPIGLWIPYNLLPFEDQMAGVYQVIGRYQNTLCADTMSGSLVVGKQPTSFPGNNTSVCYGYSKTIFGSATSYSSVQWVSRGDGNFIPETSLVTEYFPGITDLSTGWVWLILQVTGTDTCSYMVVEDSLLLTIDPLPIVDAGVDDTICEGTPSVQLYGNP
ncbi:MAG: hypothetical protein H8D88_00565, partial [Bacteroidetes bacterium]|nr:hypothetical protein [Bacteroidota bacterium]